MENTCVCCGAVIPEGRMVCPNCQHNNAFAYSNDIRVMGNGLWESVKRLDRKIRNWSIRVLVR